MRLRSRLYAVGLALTATLAAERAGAVVRSCGDDPVANTETVLCALPSGPCTPAEVVLGANVTVLDHRCVFDLGGRALRIERTLRMPKGLDTRCTIQNVADVTIARRGKLKLRGDFPGGQTDWAGAVKIVSEGAIDVVGLLDVSGDSGGLIELTATGDVTFERRSRVRGRGVSSFRDEGARFADGGALFVVASAIAMKGTLDFAGTNAAEGGGIDLLADRGVVIAGRIDASGGDDGGGDVSVTAGDDVTISASIDTRARSGEGNGGTIDVTAGLDVTKPGDVDIGAFPGGELQVHGATLDARASALGGFGGFGGDVFLTSADAIVVGSDVTVHVDSAPTGDGVGGGVVFSAGDDLSGVPRDGDLVTDAVISGRGPDRGGEVFLLAGRDVRFGGSLDATGLNGGRLSLQAGRDALVDGPVALRATLSMSQGAEVTLTAGLRANGTLRVSRDLDFAGGTPAFGCAEVVLSACTLAVDPGVTVDATCPAPAGVITETVLDLRARNVMDLGAGSRYLAGPVGRVLTSHPAAVTPTVGAGTVFTAVRADNANDSWPYVPCAP
jgi:hypothetical protein